MRFLCIHGGDECPSTHRGIVRGIVCWCFGVGRPNPWHVLRDAPPTLPERIRDARRAGVVCLLCWHDHQWCVMLILRAQDNSPHSGQLAFPGAAEAKDGVRLDSDGAS